MKALQHAMYGHAQHRTQRQGILVPGRQVATEAAGMGLRHRVRAGAMEGATATMQLTQVQDIAHVYTALVVAHVVARTQGALLRKGDIYRLGAPIMRLWRRKIGLHFKLDPNTPWLVLLLVLKVRHPTSTFYRAVVQQ